MSDSHERIMLGVLWRGCPLQITCLGHRMIRKRGTGLKESGGKRDVNTGVGMGKGVKGVPDQ